jgi:hypothetical protein
VNAAALKLPPTGKTPAAVRVPSGAMVTVPPAAPATEPNVSGAAFTIVTVSGFGAAEAGNTTVRSSTAKPAARHPRTLIDAY